MDWNDFEERASRAIPAQPLKPKRCWVGVLLHEVVGVLLHEVDPQSDLDELDFIWMFGHSVSAFSYMHASSTLVI